MPTRNLARTPFVVEDNYNQVHLMSFVEKCHCHWKASLFDLVPSKIIKLNRQKYDPLIIGYIKEYEGSNEMIFIPMYLKKLIVKFYPIFV